jgi:hypothetical protein
MTPQPIKPAPRQHTSLDGWWHFRPGPAPAGVDPRIEPGPGSIRVPGLWEAQGWPGLDGEAWYHRQFELRDPSGYWSLRFGAVMDDAEVYVNGHPAGGHVGGFTPFETDITGLVRAGRNDLAVRVTDHPLDSAAHLRSAHGKQGWMNHIFPSPPSLYMTYGGIWQPVTLLRHGGVRIEDLFVDARRDALTAQVTIANGRAAPAEVRLRWHLAHHTGQEAVVLAPGERRTLPVHVADHGLAAWSPASPVLHMASASADADGCLSDELTTRFGVREVTVSGDRLLLNGTPLRMMSALVQGFRPDTLYAEGSREQILAEVRAAKDAGFNTLRLHIKAFDPVYLDVCDELGMLVHSDLPVAEPIAHSELAGAGEVAERCEAACVEQVRRDRNHPCIVLWSAMNELGAQNPAVRAMPGYEAFARHLYEAVERADGTRPIIENDWIEPDPDRVFRSPILTAHWYGRLSAQYLESLWAKMLATATGERPFLLSEFGDWGLPDFTAPGKNSPFWWPDELARSVERLPWEGSAAGFVRGTQVYQGIADRLQIEMCRVIPGVSGWCLTELTDVPHEYNGLWSFDRRPKGPALTAVAQALRPTLPIAIPVYRDNDRAYRGSWSGWAGETLALRIGIAHDEPGTPHAEVSVAIDGTVVQALTCQLQPFRPTDAGVVTLPLPDEPGRHVVEISIGGVGSHRITTGYDVFALPKPSRSPGVRLIGAAGDLAALEQAGASQTDDGVLIIGEGALDGTTGKRIAGELAAGRDVLLLAQPAAAIAHLPGAFEAIDIATEWGSTPFLYSTPGAMLHGVEAGAVLTTQLLTVIPDVAIHAPDLPIRTMIGLYKPFPGEADSAIVASVPTGEARLWLCQLPVVAPASGGDPTAIAVLSDLLSAVAGHGALAGSAAARPEAHHAWRG